VAPLFVEEDSVDRNPACVKPPDEGRIYSSGARAFDPDHGARRRSRYHILCSSNEESVMEKRSTVHAVDAESLVFESNFGPAVGLAIEQGPEVVKRPQWIPAWSAAALILENIRVDDTPTPPGMH
jgi:hypothetical protein